MKKKYNLVDYIDACYNYIIKHTDFEPDEDLYQDIAVDYIEKYNQGIPHSQILSNLLTVYKRRYIRLSKEILPDIYIDREIHDENDLMFETIGKYNIKFVLNNLSYRKERVLYLRFYENLTLSEVGEIIGVCTQRVREIENKAIRDLRHPSLKKFIRDFYR